VGFQVRSGAAFATWKEDWAKWQGTITGSIAKYTDPRFTFSPRLLLSVPMLVSGDGGTLRDGANGRYDAHWKWLAQHLVSVYGKSLPNRFVLRLGHELNGRHYQWSADPSSHNGPTAPQDFAAYWRRIYRIMTPIVAAAGTDIVWDWNLAMGGSRSTAEEAYPGDEFVDVVTIDFYDRTGDPDRVLTKMPLSLNGWLVPFADAHGKPIGIDEWSVYQHVSGEGGGDNPAFITAVHTWIRQQYTAGRLIWHHQFDFDGKEGNRHRMRPGGLYPFTQSRARFLELFGK
jgi:hypothetical protein